MARPSSVLRRIALLSAILFTSATGVAAAATPPVTNYGDNMRSGWFPDQSVLTPDLVKGSTFGELFKKPLGNPPVLNDSINGQPIVANGQLLVVTERNYVYGLDPVTGDQNWQMQLGVAPDTAKMTQQGSTPGCGVPQYTTGITSTPVVDPDTNTMYLFSKRFITGSTGAIAYYAHALDVTTGAERPGFPKQIEGFGPDNQPGNASTFTSRWELQRPGLLLLDGVVYAAFAGHCDRGDYEGWVVGVDAKTGALTSRWVAVSEGVGAGIWQSGGGLASDGNGRIFLLTGNGQSPTVPTASDSPPQDLGQSVVQLQVGADKKLSAKQFFSPYDGPLLDKQDVDFGSGGPLLLPSPYFGTAAHPNLMVAVGKQGIVYLLDRDRLGGLKNGPGGGNDVLQEAGPIGGVWSKPSVWPGDGGHIWVNTASGGGSGGGAASTGHLEALSYGVDAEGNPKLAPEASSTDAWALDSGGPSITSSGVQSGSGIVWIVWAPSSGLNAQLRAYSAVPSASGQPVLLRSFPIVRASKFQPPGVANGRLYVTAKGCANASPLCTAYIYGFGSPITPPVTGSALVWPGTVVGSTEVQTETFTATKNNTTITKIESTDPLNFVVGTPSPGLPVTLNAGEKITVPVTFDPQDLGSVGGSLEVTTTGAAEPSTVGLSGIGLSPAPKLRPITPVSFGGTLIGGHASRAISLHNDGQQTLTVTGVDAPAAPFAVEDSPQFPFTIAGGESKLLSVGFSPTAPDQFNGVLVIHSNGGDQEVGLSGSSAAGADVQFDSLTLEFGNVAVGATVTKTFTLKNNGGSTATITRSQPPGLGRFVAVTGLAEGTSIEPGGSKVIQVSFTPNAAGFVTDGWSINANDENGRRQVTFNGTGIPGSTGGGGSLRAVAPVAFGAAAVGGHVNKTIRLYNEGQGTLTITGIDAPGAPFAVTPPAFPVTIPKAKTLQVALSFNPTLAGLFNGSLVIHTDNGDVVVALSGGIPSGADVDVTPLALDYGNVVTGTTVTKSFTLTNHGTGTATITQSDPPSFGRFTAVTPLPEGTTIAPGASKTVEVTYAPTDIAAASDVWSISANDENDERDVMLTGAGIAQPAGPVGPGTPNTPSTPSTPIVPTTPLTPIAPQAAVISKLTQKGLRLSFDVSAPTKLSVLVKRRAVGRKVKGKCVKLTSKNRKSRDCGYWVFLKNKTTQLGAGSKKVALPKLVKGTYLATVTPIPAAGQGTPKPVNLRFTIKTKKKKK